MKIYYHDKGAVYTKLHNTRTMRCGCKAGEKKVRSKYEWSLDSVLGGDELKLMEKGYRIASLGPLHIHKLSGQFSWTMVEAVRVNLQIFHWQLYSTLLFNYKSKQVSLG